MKTYKVVVGTTELVIDDPPIGVIFDIGESAEEEGMAGTQAISAAWKIMACTPAAVEAFKDEEGLKSSIRGLSGFRAILAFIGEVLEIDMTGDEEVIAEPLPGQPEEPRGAAFQQVETD